MTRQILSDIYKLKIESLPVDSKYIEEELSKIYSEVVRWAIIKVEGSIMTASVTYVKNK